MSSYTPTWSAGISSKKPKLGKERDAVEEIYCKLEIFCLWSLKVGCIDDSPIGESSIITILFVSLKQGCPMCVQKVTSDNKIWVYKHNNCPSWALHTQISRPCCTWTFEQFTIHTNQCKIRQLSKDPHIYLFISFDEQTTKSSAGDFLLVV